MSATRHFLSSCRYVFEGMPDNFVDDKQKILYAASHFTGIAREWFEVCRESDEWEDDWARHGEWRDFEKAVKSLFGDPAEEDTYENKLSVLRQKDDERITGILTKFKLYTKPLGWNDKALLDSFKKVIAPRLKEVISKKMHPPTTLIQYQQLCISLDMRYWKREEEKRFERTGRYPRSDSNHFKDKDGRNQHEDDRGRHDRNSTRDRSDNSRQSQPRRDSGPSRYSSESTRSRPDRNNDNRSRSSRPSNTGQKNFRPNPGGSGARPTPLNPQVERNLGPDGKLKGNVREYRESKGLCLYCGANNHQLANCPIKPDSNNGSRPAPASSRPASSARMATTYSYRRQGNF